MSDYLPPVVGRLVGDTRDFTSKMEEAGKVHATATSAMESRSATMAKRIGVGAAAVGGFAAGIGLTITKLGDNMRKAEVQLEKSISNTGRNASRYRGQINDTEDSLRKFGFRQEEVDRALASMTTKLQDPTKALSLMGVAADVAAAKHISLESASTLVMKAADGNAKVLKGFGIVIQDTKKATADLAATQKEQADAEGDLKKSKQDLLDLQARQAEKDKLSVGDQQALRDAQAKVVEGTKRLADANGTLAAKQKDVDKAQTAVKGGLDELTKRVGGQAQAQTDNFSGKVKELRIRLEEMVAELGQKVGPGLTIAGTALGAVASIVQIMLVPAIGTATVAIGPWVLAIGAVIAAAYMLATSWDSVSKLIRDYVRFLVDGVLGALEWIVRGAAAAFGWVPGLGPKLKEAAKWFEKFRDEVNISLGGIQDKTVNVRIKSTGTEALSALVNQASGSGTQPKRTSGTAGLEGLIKRAGGGPVRAGEPYLIGEDGPEIMWPDQAGTVIPNGGGGRGSALGSSSVVLHVHFHGGTFVGGDRQALADEMARPIRDALIREGGYQRLGLGD